MEESKFAKPSTAAAARSSRQNDSDSLSDTHSIKSASTTFRDTEIEEDLATSLLKMQSLTSIVNDPKSDSGFFK